MQYFFADGNQQKGPFPLEALSGQGLKPDSLVWREGMSQWQRADSLAELASVIGAAPFASGGPSSDPPPPFVPAPAAAPAYPAAPYSPAYQQPVYYGGYQAAPPANGMAIASMIVGIVSIPMMLFYCLGLPCALVAIILGHVVRGKVRRGEAVGGGMALAGMLCGYASLLLAAVLIALFAFFLHYSAVHGH